MNNNEQIMPVSHGAAGTTAHVAAGAAGGAVKSGASWYGIAALVTTVVGAGIGALVTSGVTLTSAPIALPAIVTGILVGGGIGAVAGLFGVGPFAGGIGALLGGFGGGAKAHDKVKAENAAANVMQSQIDLAKAQIMAQSQSPANDNKYDFPPQGSAMNQAATTLVGGNNMQLAGRAIEAQRQVGA